MEMMPTDSGPLVEPSRKRLRTSHACDLCRSRKTRCDGNHPCRSCGLSNNACTYGSEANTRGKSDLILEAVLRIEDLLEDMRPATASAPATEPRATASPAVSSPTGSGSLPCENFSCSQVAAELHRRRQQTPLSDTRESSNLENAVLSMHTSTTESVLQWPHFDFFPSLRRDYVSIFRLEQTRPPLQTRSSTVYPYTTVEDVDGILRSFGQALNFWYPTMSCTQLERVRDAMVTGSFERDGTSGCLALLTMALGCAGQVSSGLAAGPAALREGERQLRSARRALGDMYFDSALKRLHVVHIEVGATAAHCLFFVAAYFAFLRRPLQAWEYINAASAKCLLLLSYPPADGSSGEQERIRRLFWSCYILESDYLAELSGLPQSGISRIESSVPLPGAYHTHYPAQEEEQSSLYFLACISMRRLLNRVHQLLYASGTGTYLDSSRFPSVVAELNRQLDDWRDVLPPAFVFDVGPAAPAPATEHGAFLRQRYLACRSVIYRPYLAWMLAGAPAGDGGGRELVLANCRACLDACLMHILNLRAFTQTVLVDTWICSLSMAAAMLILLAACRMPALRDLIGPGVLAAGAHLKRLLRGWQQVSGDPSSPSVDQSVHIIEEAGKFIGQVYGIDTLPQPQAHPRRRQSEGRGST